jgi:hypothetical protein
MKKLLAASSVILALTGLMCSGAAAGASAAMASSCTATNGNTCDYGHWILYNNTWGPTPGTYVIHAQSQSDWNVVADQNGGGGCGGCAVEAYESAQWDYSSVPYSSIKSLSSTFSETMPTGSLKSNGVDAEAAYDMFIKGSDTDEVMVWVDNQGQTPAGSLDTVATINGQKFKVYVSGGTKSFVLTKNETSGTVNYHAVLSWLHAHGMLASSDTLSQFNFGWEICDTGGKARTFTVHSLTLHQSL